jgi:hypothetical protein
MPKFYIMLEIRGNIFSMTIEAYHYGAAEEVGREIAEALGAQYRGVLNA